MVTKMRYENGNYVPLHSHPNEQSGYVISGKYRLKVGDQNVSHSIKIIEAGEVVDVFTPLREDYLT